MDRRTAIKAALTTLAPAPLLEPAGASLLSGLDLSKTYALPMKCAASMIPGGLVTMMMWDPEEKEWFYSEVGMIL